MIPYEFANYRALKKTNQPYFDIFAQFSLKILLHHDHIYLNLRITTKGQNLTFIVIESSK